MEVGELRLTTEGHLLGEVCKQPIVGFWVTLGFPYHLPSVPIIEPSVLQEKAGSHRLLRDGRPRPARGEMVFQQTVSLVVLLPHPGVLVVRHHVHSGTLSLLPSAFVGSAHQISPERSFPTCLCHGPSSWREKEFTTHHRRPPLVPCCSSGLGSPAWLRTDPGEGRSLKGQFTCALERDHFSGSRKGTYLRHCPGLC